MSGREYTYTTNAVRLGSFISQLFNGEQKGNNELPAIKFLCVSYGFLFYWFSLLLRFLFHKVISRTTIQRMLQWPRTAAAHYSALRSASGEAARKGRKRKKQSLHFGWKTGHTARSRFSSAPRSTKWRPNVLHPAVTRLSSYGSPDPPGAGENARARLRAESVRREGPSGAPRLVKTLFSRTVSPPCKICMTALINTPPQSPSSVGETRYWFRTPRPPPPHRNSDSTPSVLHALPVRFNQKGQLPSVRLESTLHLFSWWLYPKRLTAD